MVQYLAWYVLMYADPLASRQCSEYCMLICCIPSILYTGLHLETLHRWGAKVESRRWGVGGDIICILTTFQRLRLGGSKPPPPPPPNETLIDCTIMSLPLPTSLSSSKHSYSSLLQQTNERKYFSKFVLLPVSAAAHTCTRRRLRRAHD